MGVIQTKKSNVNAPHLSGFRFGIKQSSIRLGLNLKLPKALDFHLLENELLDRFGIEHQKAHSRIDRSLTEFEQSALHFTWLTMGLACHLLQAIKIPCFDHGLTLDIHPIDETERRYSASYQFPIVEHHPATWVSQCVSWSYRIMTQLAQRDVAKNNIAETLEKLHEEFVTPAKKQIPGGDSTIPVLKTAYQLNIPFIHLGWGIYQLGWGAKGRLSDRSTSELDSAIGSKISHNKLQTAHLLKQAGLPAPLHQPAATLETAIEIAQNIGFPVVIKPADKDRGEGVTVDIYDTEGVAAAFDKALKLSKNILVEKQIPGVCYRILVVGDTSPYTVGRLPLGVEGNGIHTVKELIEQANEKEARKAKHRRQKNFPSDELAEDTLKQQGLDFDSVPSKGLSVPLRPIESTEWGGLPEVMSDEIHPDNVRIAIQAARLLNLNVAGIDLISEDIRKPWYENGAVINEVNFAPFLGARHEYQRVGVKQLVQKLFPTDGRIPVEIFIGDEHAWELAVARQREMVSTGIRTYICSHTKTVDIHGGINLSINGISLSERSKALLMNREVEALILVVQTDELLSSGLPVDSVNSITLVNKNLVAIQDLTQPAHPRTS